MHRVLPTVLLFFLSIYYLNEAILIVSIRSIIFKFIIFFKVMHNCCKVLKDDVKCTLSAIITH